MKYSVEIHKRSTENTHGDLIKVIDVFDTENDAYECMYKNESLIKNDEIIDVYLCE